MFYSYGSARNLYGTLTNDSTSGNLINGDIYINASISELIGKKAWPFLHRESTGTTVANQQHVVVPRNYVKMKSVKVRTGTTEYSPREAPNREFWDQLNYTVATANTSDVPEWWYFFNGRCHFVPTPATSGNTVTFYGKIGFRGLSISEYNTSTILTLTTGSTNVVGGSTVWTTNMAGRYIKVFEAQASENKGDSEWYEIGSVVSNTQLTLVKPYLGANVTAGTATYVIGQIAPIPEEYGEYPIFRATEIYYSAKTTPGSGSKAQSFKTRADELAVQMESDYGAGTDNVLVDEADVDSSPNPNLFVRL